MTCVRILLVATGLWLPTAARADEPKAATPEALVEKLQAAAEAGDPGALFPLVGGPNRPLAEQMVGVLKAGEAFEKALDGKFGKDPAYQSKYVGGRVKGVEMRGKKDVEGGVELTLWTTRSEGEKEVVVESREVAIRENGGWVLRANAPFSATTSREEKRRTPGGEVTVRVDDPPQALTEGERTAARDILPGFRAVLEKGARDVAAGTYATRKDAAGAVEKAVERVLTIEPPAATGRKDPRP